MGSERCSITTSRPHAQEATMTDTSTNRSGTSGSVLTDKTDELIASNKVEGTAVYNHQGERIGTLHHFMVGKRSGQVAYAVMSFGGLFGVGEGSVAKLGTG